MTPEQLQQLRTKYGVPDTGYSPAQPEATKEVDELKSLWGEADFKKKPVLERVASKTKDFVRTTGGALVQPFESTIRNVAAPIEAGLQSLKTGEDFGTEYSKVIENVKKAPSLTKSISGGTVEAPARDLRTEYKQAAGDLILSAPVGKALQLGGVALKTGGKVLPKVAETAGIGALGGFATGLQEDSDLLGTVGRTALGGALGGTLGLAGAGLTAMLKPQAKKFEEAVNKVFPTMAKDIKGGIKNKVDNVYNAMSDILQNKEKGIVDDITGIAKDPKKYSYADLQEVSDKRMKELYQEYTAKLNDVDKEKFGALISQRVQDQVKILETNLAKENLQANRNVMQQKINELRELRDTSPQGIQNYVEGLNQEAKWVPGSALTVEKIQAANLAGEMRKVLDESIEKVGDTSYQGLRNLYKSHRGIKDQLAVLAAREIRDTPGLVKRMTNMGITAAGLESLLSGNPKGVLLALGVKAGSKVWEYFGGRQRGIGQIFKILEKNYKPASSIKENIAQPIIPPTSNVPIINNIDNTILQKTVSAIDDVENLQWLEEVSKQGPSEKVFIPKGLIQEKIDELTEEIGKRRMSKEFNVQALENLKNSFAGGGFDFATYARMRNAGVRDIESLNKSGLGKSGQSVLRQLEDYAGDKDISEMMSQADDILDLIKTAKGPVGTKELISERARLISEEMYENAKKNFKENMGRINSGIPVDQIKDLTVMAAYHIERGVRSAAELAKVYAEAGYNFTKKELESLYNKAIKEKPTIVSGSKLPLNKIEELEQFKGFFDADTQKFSSPEIKKDAIKFLVDNDIDIKSTKDADIVDHIDEILTRRESLRKVTAGEVKGVSKELQPLYNEAKKYKSAEEFVNNQKKLFRGSTNAKRDERTVEGVLSTSENPDIAKIFSGENGKIEEFILDPNAKIIKVENIPKELVKSTRDWIKYAKDNGYDAIDMKSIKLSIQSKTNPNLKGFEDEIKIINPSVLKTKSQLTDIWNKAQKLKPNPLIQEAEKTPKTVNVYVKSKFSEGGGYKDVPVIRKVDNVTLYQGSNAGDKRQFWTDSKKYASQFGEVKEKTGSFYQVDNGNRVTNVYVEVKPKAPLKSSTDSLIQGAKKYKSAEEFVKGQTPRVGGVAPELQGQTLYRGMSEGEWQALQAGEVSGKASKGGRTFLTTEKQTAEMAVEAGKGKGVIVELKPEAGQKVISGGKIGENTGGNLPGEYQARNIGIDDIAKVTDGNGKVIYEATTGGKTKSQLEQIWKEANKKLDKN